MESVADQYIKGINVIRSDGNVRLHIPEFESPEYFSKEIDFNIPSKLKKFFKQNHNSNYFNYIMFMKIFNIGLEYEALPLFYIKNNKIKRISAFFEDYNLEEYSKRCISKYKVIFIRNKIHHQQINTGDLILAAITPGIHLVNVKFIYNKILKNPNIFPFFSNNLNILDYLILPTTDLNHMKTLKNIWSGRIKKVITPTGWLGDNLDQYIPDGKRAVLHNNLWGIDHNLQYISKNINLEYTDLYYKLNGGIGIMFIISPNDLHYICNQYAHEHGVPLVNIGSIVDGNLGPKTNLIIY